MLSEENQKLREQCLVGLTQLDLFEVYTPVNAWIYKTGGGKTVEPWMFYVCVSILSKNKQPGISTLNLAFANWMEEDPERSVLLYVRAAVAWWVMRAGKDAEVALTAAKPNAPDWLKPYIETLEKELVISKNAGTKLAKVPDYKKRGGYVSLNYERPLSKPATFDRIVEFFKEANDLMNQARAQKAEDAQTQLETKKNKVAKTTSPKKTTTGEKKTTTKKTTAKKAAAKKTTASSTDSKTPAATGEQESTKPAKLTQKEKADLAADRYLERIGKNKRVLGEPKPHRGPAKTAAKTTNKSTVEPKTRNTTSKKKPTAKKAATSQTSTQKSTTTTVDNKEVAEKLKIAQRAAQHLLDANKNDES